MNEEQYNELLALILSLDMSIQGYVVLTNTYMTVSEHGYTEEVKEQCGEELERVIKPDGPLTKDIVLNGLVDIITSAVTQIEEFLKCVIKISIKYKDEDPGKVSYVLDTIKSSRGLEILGTAITQQLELPILGKAVSEDLLRSFSTTYLEFQKIHVQETPK